MLNITLAQLKSDITPKLRGTSLDEIADFYGTAGMAMNRMLGRIDPQESRRITTLSTPFWDNVNDYTCPEDYKAMIDIGPTGGRYNSVNPYEFTQTNSRQFATRLDADSFSIQWNNMVRTIRAQVLPQGNVNTMDEFSSPTGNGAWIAQGGMQAAWDSSINWDQGTEETWDDGLYTEPLNYIQGSSAVGFNLLASTTSAYMYNTTAAAVDLSQFNYQDASMVFFYIPVGYSSRFTSFELRRGSDISNYVSCTVTTKADGTAFTDGWNFLVFNWNLGTNVGAPDDTQNTYRYFGVNYTSGNIIKGCVIDSWTDSLGRLYEIEYFSSYGFRTAAGAWISVPTQDTDLVNVDYDSYEIFKTEMLIDITEEIRTGAVRDDDIANLRRKLNGDPQSRYVKDPNDRGLYINYMLKHPSNAIISSSSYYDFDL